MGQLLSCFRPPLHTSARPLTSDQLHDSDGEDDFWDARSEGSLYSTGVDDEFRDQWLGELDGDAGDDVNGQRVIDEATRTREGNFQSGLSGAVELENKGGTPELLQQVKTRLEAEEQRRHQIKHDANAPLPITRLHVQTESIENIDPNTSDSSENYAAITSTLQNAHHLQRQGRILEAHALLRDLCTRCSFPSLSSLHPFCSGADCNMHVNDVAALESDVAAAHAALSTLDNDDGWVVSREGKLRVLYKHKKGTTQHALQFRAVFPHRVEHILSLAHEWDLLPTWNKFALEAIKLAEPSTFESFVYGAQWMMLPFKPMQAVVRARGFDLASSHKCLLILISDVADPATDLPAGHAPLPAAMEKRRTVNILPQSCIKLRPLPPSEDGSPQTEAHLVVHLDPHIPYVPGSLVNFVLGILAPYIFGQMNKVLTGMFADAAHGEFPKRVREQPELYGLIEQRMAEFAHELG